MPYFDETPVSKWSITMAYNNYQKKHPEKDRRQLLQIINDDLKALEKSKNAQKGPKAYSWRRDWSKIIRKVPEQTSICSSSSSSTPLDKTDSNIHFNVDNIKLTENSVFTVGGSNVITTSPSSGFSSIPPTSNAPMSTTNTLPSTSTGPSTDDLSLFDQSFAIQDSTGAKRNIDSILEINDDSFDTHKRRRYVLNYMVNVDRCWEPSTYLTLQNLNITQKFQEFRNRSILLADAKHNISDNRLLSLSNIFSITPSQSTSCLHRVHPSYYKSIMKLIKRKQGWASLPFPARTWCSTVDELIGRRDKLPVKKLYALIRKFGNASAAAFGDGDSDDDDDDENEDDDNDDNKNNHGNTNTINENKDLDDHTDDDDDDDENVDDLLLTTNILDNLVGAFQNWIDNCVFESTFIQQHLSPFMIPVFQRLSITLRLGETHVNNDPTSLLADYVGTYQTTSGNKFDVLSCEVKPFGKKSSSQVQSDFTKLGKELKQMVDKLLDYGIESPVVVGVLVEGYSMKTYSMRLVEDGCYIFYEHGSLTLLRSPQDVHGVPIIIEHLIQLGNILQDTLKNIDTRSLSTDTPNNAPVYWKRQSSGTPLRTNEER
ncbi:hypothetical protein INT45_000834 [Circinella minor]|uniref:Uncharacterized protein n=1 Tax=Circinella minor TaxID=1195481 RepID=A0A8H7S4P8_9FUNG|nr:hypothetical protein INT45_000834 [Circinella minor]